MSNYLSLPADIRQLMSDCLDDLIEIVGKDCKLYYAPEWVECANCVLDPVAGVSSNIWRTGGPMWFSDGQVCPICSGNGLVAHEAYDSVKFACEWNPRRFQYGLSSDKQVRKPYSIVQTRGYMTDYWKVRNCSYMVFESAIAPMDKFRYKLLMSPGDYANFVQGRYFIAVWEQE